MFARNYNFKNVELSTGSYGSFFGYVVFKGTEVQERHVDGYAFTGKDDDVEDEGDHDLTHDEVTELNALFDAGVAEWAASNDIEGKGLVVLDGSVIGAGAAK